MNIKEFLFNALEGRGNFYQKLIGITISILIILNILLVIIETVPELKKFSYYFKVFEIVSIIIFSIEYILRVWTSNLIPEFQSRIKYILSPLLIFDALVIFPGIISIFFPNIFDGRILRLIRVFRVFRLNQYSHSIKKILSIIHKHKKDLISTFSLIIMSVIIASTFMYYAEKDFQPHTLGSIPLALYWGFITISTVGYGDITPITNLGKFITVITTLLGVALYTLPTSILGAAFYAEIRSKEAITINKLENKIEKMDKELNILRIFKKEHIKKSNTNHKKTSFFTKIFS
jgi:voltage-gated potassium channel